MTSDTIRPEPAAPGQSLVSMDMGSELSPLRPHNGRSWRNLIAYWLLGLCNNYGYVVMLSAAHDVLSPQENDNTTTTSQNNSTDRDCNPMSTGAILLADILPSLFIKIVAPFLPFYVHLRVMIVIVLSCAGFLLVALSLRSWMTILGVISTSFASGLGELTFLAYSYRFERESISMWSSGTGGAGIFGAGSYAGLTALGLSPRTSLLLMLVVPALMGVAFWGILRHPVHTLLCCVTDMSLDGRVDEDQTQSSPSSPSTDDNPVTYEERQSVLAKFYGRLRDIPPLLRYMVPLGLVYLFEYFINQGLFELIYYRDIKSWMNHEEQYRWLQLDYQIGVFLSRSSASFFTVRAIWLMSVLQFLNVVIFTFEAIYRFMPSIWLVFVIVLWEGMLGGGAYVNTYHRIANEVSPAKKEFSLGITTVADAIGIGLAGALAIPVHNIICALPAPESVS